MEKDFIKAAKNGDHTKIVEMLASNPALLEARDKDDSTALHCACWKGHLEIVATLLAAGAPVDIHNKNDHWGTTPLHAAAHANQAAIAEMLIQHGADPNALDRNGQTPLHHTTFHKAGGAAKVLKKHSLQDK
ncbi:MAG: ankyrin repeat domain-containing protein [Capsulimonas sp.]|uniref:ankyrin repeat domain-containing protein n=1 Tax=Capsulimonas sp. TaxID=2494211 RepID=UPI00326730F6